MTSKSRPEGWHLPALGEESIVVKTFWITEGQLPVSANLSDYYSYQPPGKPRQYLGGIHVNYGMEGEDLFVGGDAKYWRWATFWVPKPPGDVPDLVTMGKLGAGPILYFKNLDKSFKKKKKKKR